MLYIRLRIDRYLFFVVSFDTDVYFYVYSMIKYMYFSIVGYGRVRALIFS